MRKLNNYFLVCVNWTNTDPLDSSTSSSTQSPTPVTTTPVTSTPTPAVKSPPPRMFFGNEEIQ